VLAVVIVSVLVARLEPAAPSVPRASVWIDNVREGEMLRQVRGPGTLVPREIRWIAAQTTGHVERVIVKPGAVVTADTVLVEMTNPDLMRETDEAKFALDAAVAELAEMKLTLKSQQLDQRAALASARTEYESARLEAEANKAAGDVIPALTRQRSELLAAERKERFEIETDRITQFTDTMKAQIMAREAKLAGVRNAYERKQQQVEWLKVRAGVAGVLQQMLAEDGQTLALGQNIARVARPDDLRAEINIPETQARDVRMGQIVSVDTRNGIVAGHVVRIDPAVQQGTVQVDVDFSGPLPDGARPDLSVDGTIEIERLPRVLFTGRPAYGQPNSTVGLFKLVEDGRYAVQVPVEIGRTSVNAVEIVKGLAAGDQVILSDTSAWADNDRIRLN